MSIAETWAKMAEAALAYMPVVAVSLAVFLVFWIAGRAADRMIRRFFVSRRIDPDVIGLLAESAKIALLVFGALTALGTLGVNVTAMVAGLGLTGLALGLALKEIVSNALAGVLILVYKPFKRNDEIGVLTFQGSVVEVNLRYTTIQSATGRVFIPNTILLTNAVSLISVGKEPNGGSSSGGKPNGGQAGTPPSATSA